ncbi:AMP-binding protein [Sphingobium phenoxybenzoativorans]
MERQMASSVYDQFRDTATQSPDHAFLCYPMSDSRGYMAAGGEIFYGEALRIIDALAQRYEAAGYGPGHRVALVAGNRPEHFFHLMALNKIGCTAVPLNPDYLNHEFAFGIEFAECSLVIGANPRLDDLQQVTAALTPPVPLVDAERLPETLPKPARAAAVSSPTVGEREAMIIYTSGTTGRPKGCIISNISCLASGENYSTAGGLLDWEKGKERLYIPLPSFHMNLSIYTLNTMVRMHSCLVIQDRFRLSNWWSDIVETGATCFHYMGIIPALLMKAPESEIEKHHKIKFAQGAGVDGSIKKAFEKRFGFPLIEAWGMTETSRAIQNSREPVEPGAHAFGRPRAPLEVMIADDNDQPVPFSTPGELLIRAQGPDPRHGFFSGYLKQPEETEKAWRNGWFHTGDIVTQRDDGMLFFVERRKNIIRRSGENIASAEIEDALIDNPEVASVAVMSVPDELHNEEVIACVVLAKGVQASADKAMEIQDRARAKLAYYKLPAWIAFIDKVPVTGTQKVQKGQIFVDIDDPREDPRTIDLRAFKRRKATANAASKAS